MSYNKMFTAQFGRLYPVYLQDCVPNDVWKGGNELIVRMQPLVAPVLHEINAYIHYFFVPYRILGSIVGASNPFTSALTGFKNGTGYERASDTCDYNMPRVDKSSISLTLNKGIFTDSDGKKHRLISNSNTNDYLNPSYLSADGSYNVLTSFVDALDMTGDVSNGGNYYLKSANGLLTFTRKNTLWDFFGFPTDLTNLNVEHSPLMFPWYAYNYIYNEYYRDENLQYPVPRNNNSILFRSWEKDFFTSALPFQQKGSAPKIPVFGVEPISFTSASSYFGGSVGTKELFLTVNPTNNIININDSEHAVDNNLNIAKVGADSSFDSVTNFSININDIRLANSIQLWQERNARCGNRYNEFLLSHFGVSNGDDRLNRPIYLGGTKSPLVISEVLQQSESNGSNALGSMGGHGISASSNFVDKYHVKEHGLIMGIMSIMPKGGYSAQGISLDWVKNTRFDWYSPEFADLGEQPIPTGSIFADGSENDLSTFGFQGAFDYMRSRQNEVTGNMRDTFQYWHCNRAFNSSPILNDKFLRCNNSDINRIFAVQDEDGFIVNLQNVVSMIRPLPALSIPRGL